MSHKVSKQLIIKSVMLGTTGLSSAPSALTPPNTGATVFQLAHDRIARYKKHRPLLMVCTEATFDMGVLIAYGSLAMFIAEKITEVGAVSLILGWIYPLRKKGNWFWQNSIVLASQLLGIITLALLTRTDTYERMVLAGILLFAQIGNPLYNSWKNMALANACNMSSDPTNTNSTVVDCGEVWDNTEFLVKALIPGFAAFLVLIVAMLYREVQRNIAQEKARKENGMLRQTNDRLRIDLSKVKGHNAAIEEDLAEAKEEIAKLKGLPSSSTSPTPASGISKLETIPTEESSPKAPEVDSTTPLASTVGNPTQM